MVIVNTCGFIEDAKKESIENILEFAQLKKEGQIRKIIVTGCMAERYKDELLKELPECDAVLGLGANGDIVEAVGNRPAGRADGPFSGQGVLESGRKPAADHPGFLRLSADRGTAAITVVPIARSRLSAAGCSRDRDAVVEEARGLAERGVKELTLVAQDTTLYGADWDGESHLPELLGGSVKSRACAGFGCFTAIRNISPIVCWT